MANYPKQPEQTQRVSYSITSRLNTKLFLRLLGVLISIDIMICVIAAAALIIHCETKIANAADALSEHETPPNDEWLDIAGLRIQRIDEPTVTGLTPWPFTQLLPYKTETATRGFRATRARFKEAVRSVTYIVDIEVNGNIYEIKQQIGQYMLLFIYAFTTLFAFEIIELLSRTVKDRRMVRRTLDPIAELARTARSLNEVNKQLDYEKMAALAGRVNGFDAGHLDTRIQIDDLQEELKNVAVAINGMLDRINESYAAQMRFVSDASHELRTPIAVIQGYANLLDRWGKEDEKTLSESVSAIKDEAGNMKDLVEQLLFLARGDSNRIIMTEERVELTPLIEEVADESRMLDSGHDFKTNAADIAINADRTLIKQALRVLVDNAIKYTDAGGEITITANRDGDTARLSVTDNGIGIKPDILPYVFDRFVRADESRARATGGAGLGLSIAHWITTRHNGHVEVLSREQIGTRITLVFPAAA